MYCTYAYLISAFLDHYLKPLVPLMPSYISDSGHIITTFHCSLIPRPGNEANWPGNKATFTGKHIFAIKCWFACSHSITLNKATLNVPRSLLSTS